MRFRRLPPLFPDAFAALTIERARQAFGTTFPTATATVEVLEDLGIMAELTGQKTNRNFSYQPYIALLAL